MINRTAIFTIAILSALLTSACIKVNMITAGQGPSNSGDPKYVFKMTDGYFQIRGHQPIHLTHEPLPKERAWLGDAYQLWFDLKLDKETLSPCSKRSEKTCTEILELVGKDETGANKIWTHVKAESRISEDFSKAFGVPNGISRQAALGNAVIRYRIIYGEEILFFYEIPIEIN